MRSPSCGNMHMTTDHREGGAHELFWPGTLRCQVGE
jgi:hypothetical protein